MIVGSKVALSFGTKQLNVSGTTRMKKIETSMATRAQNMTSWTC